MLFFLKTLNKLISTILVLFKGKSQEQSSSLLGFNIKKVVLLMILYFRDLINKQQNQNLFLLLLFRKQEKKRVYFFRPSFPRKYLNYLDATKNQSKQASKQAKKEYLESILLKKISLKKYKFFVNSLTGRYVNLEHNKTLVIIYWKLCTIMNLRQL